MAETRYRGARHFAEDDRFRGSAGRDRPGFGRDDDRGDSDRGYIARRGFGNERSGFGRDERSDWGYPPENLRSGRDYENRDRDTALGGYGRGPYGRPSGGASGGYGNNDFGRGGLDWGYGRDRRYERNDRPERNDRYERGERYRDHPTGYYGDSAGYGSGGSTEDYRDVVGSGYEGTGFGAMANYPGPERTFAGPYGYGAYGREEGYESGRSYRGDRGFFQRAEDEIASWFGDEDAERRRRMDAREGDQGAVQHRGRGPRGYVRSDERVREDVSDRLTDDPHIDASDIEVSVSGREVTLSGTVSSRFAKRHAEDIAESVSGVTHVQNNLRIKDRSRDEAVGGAEMTTYGVSATSGTTGTSGGSGRASGTGTSRSRRTTS